MISARRILSSGAGRLVCLLQVVFLLVATSCVLPGSARPVPGRRDYQERMVVAVPGGHVQVAGGNLMLRRVDHSVDTLLGTHEVGAVYNSATGRWLWSFELRYDGATFVDESGAELGIGALPFGAAIPGTVWVKLDAARIKTKGGSIYEFDPLTGRLSTIRRPMLASPKLVHHVQNVSGFDRIVRISQCRADQTCEDVYRIGYDEHGCVAEIEDRAGQVSRFEHDPSCRLLSARDALDVEQGWAGWSYEYAGSLLSAITSSEGERVEYDYLDGRLLRARAIGGENPAVRFSYGINLTTHVYYTQVVDVRGGHSTYHYDVGGRLLEVADAAGDLTRFAWQGLRPVSITDAAGLTTLYEYAADDPVRVTFPSGNAVEIAYEPEAVNHAAPRQRAIRRISDALGLVQERGYAGGQLESLTNGAGEVTHFVYDGEGSLVFLTDASGIVTAFDMHGPHGHATRIVQAGIAVERSYDAIGNLLEGGVLDDPLAPALPGAGRRYYDADRNLVAIELHGGSEAQPFDDAVAMLTIERRSDGRPTRILRPYGGDSEMVYDALGRLFLRREKVDGALVETVFSHDRAGQLVALELANGMRREIDYDAVGRETAVRLLRDGVVEKSLASQWVEGRLVSRSDSSHGNPERFVYDEAGRLAEIAYPGGEVLELGHDLRSREILRRYRPAAGAPPIRTLSFGYDAADRQILLLDEGEPVLERVIEQGRTTSIRYGNGLTRRFEYEDDHGLLARSDTYDAEWTFLERTTIERLACETDRLCLSSSSLLDQDRGGPYAGSTDELHRLAPLPGGNPAAPPGGMPGARLDYWEVVAGSNAGYLVESRRLAFDQLGNQIGSESGAGLEATFGYNVERNRLLTSDDGVERAYAWDVAGYLISRDGAAIGWDAGGRLASLGSDLELEWDVSGRLLRSRIQGVESRTLFGGQVRGDAEGRPVAIDLGEVEIGLAAGGRLYRHLDFRRNVQFVSDDAGLLAQRYVYSSFGVVQVVGDHPDGRQFAQGTKLGELVLIGARVYDPQTGRFISPDPLYDPINQYAYTLGDPVRLWDPTGSQPQTVDRGSVQIVSEWLMRVGLVVLAAGIAAGNPQAAGAGAGMVTTSLVIDLATAAQGGDSVGLADPQQGDTGDGNPQAAEAAELTGCSPVSLARSAGPAWPVGGLGLLLLVAIQLGLAVVVLRTRRREE